MGRVVGTSFFLKTDNEDSPLQSRQRRDAQFYAASLDVSPQGNNSP